MKNDKEKIASCPKCNSKENQTKRGFTSAGSQKYFCKHCNCMYTPNPKHRAYTEETRALAIKTYYAGVSGRGVGKIFGMSKANVYNWIKKTGNGVDNSV